MTNDRCLLAGHIPAKFEMTGRVYLTDGITPTVRPFSQGGGNEIKILAKEQTNMAKVRIRKLTEGECYRFMGFEKKDYEACKEAGQSRANIYHQAGDSIVTTVLVGIFGQLLGIEPEPIIESYVDGLADEVCEDGHKQP